MYSMALGGGIVIAGEPQVRVGDFVFHDKWREQHDSQSLAYAMCGRIDESDWDYLNGIFESFVTRYAARYSGEMHVHYGMANGYHWRHIRHLPLILQKADFPMERLFLIEHDIKQHADVIPIFQSHIASIFSSPQ